MSCIAIIWISRRCKWSWKIPAIKNSARFRVFLQTPHHKNEWIYVLGPITLSPLRRLRHCLIQDGTGSERMLTENFECEFSIRTVVTFKKIIYWVDSTKEMGQNRESIADVCSIITFISNLREMQVLFFVKLHTIISNSNLFKSYSIRLEEEEVYYP